MICRRSEELWSDYLEGTLAPPLAGELRAHLAACDTCSQLFAAFEEVVAGLGALSFSADPEKLTEHVLDRTRPKLAARRRDAERFVAVSAVPLRQAASWIAAAAVLAFVLLWRPPEALPDWSRKASQSVHQAYSFGVRTYHQSERWIEELNVLRMTVGVAFEDRLEEINRRLRDLEEASRRAEDEESEQSRRNDASSSLLAHVKKLSQTRSLL